MMKNALNSPGTLTRQEIFRQPLLWPTTLARVQRAQLACVREARPVILTGAGTSAYAAAAIAAPWPEARAIPTTDLLLYTEHELAAALPRFSSGGLLISIARSGDSPESLGVVSKFQRDYPEVDHLVITCNENGALARIAGAERIVLDPRTNDQSLAMTSSFSNLTLAGLALRHGAELDRALPAICKRAEEALPGLDEAARGLANTRIDRIAVLASAPLRSLAIEAALKVLEMTAGRVVAFPETFLGLRHGPMSFLRTDSLVLCFLSSTPNRRRYEQDLMRELQSKSLGRIVAIGTGSETADFQLAAQACEVPDHLRVPFEIPFAQLLAFHLSLEHGLNPDNPSPEGVITRVVPSFRMHEEAADV